MEMNDAPPCFAALGSPGRLAVFRLLMRHAPQGVRPTEIAQALDLKQNTLSHHLAALEQVGLIGHRRDGRQVFYTLQDEHVADLIRIAREHFAESIGQEAGR